MLRSIPALSRAEWLRLSGFGGAVALLHVLGWGLFLYFARTNPALAGLGDARVHVRAAARVRRRPHRGDRQHDAQVPAGGEAAARRRLLLLARPLERRASRSTASLAFGAASVKAQIPSFQHWGGYVGAGVSGTFLLDHRDPQPARPARHRPHLPRACAPARSTRSGSSSGCSTAA